MITELFNDSIKKGLIEPKNISDGYHTFDELYKHRAILFITLCKELESNPSYQEGQKSNVWKSKKHSDNTDFKGWFIMGIGKEKGEQITYHLPNEYWDKVNFAQELDKSPEFDGHTSNDVLTRLLKL